MIFHCGSNFDTYKDTLGVYQWLRSSFDSSPSPARRCAGVGKVRGEDGASPTSRESRGEDYYRIFRLFRLDCISHYSTGFRIIITMVCCQGPLLIFYFMASSCGVWKELVKTSRTETNMDKSAFVCTAFKGYGWWERSNNHGKRGIPIALTFKGEFIIISATMGRLIWVCVRSCGSCQIVFWCLVIQWWIWLITINPQSAHLLIAFSFSFHTLLYLFLSTYPKSDEEPVDPMPRIRKECVKTCPGPLANYEACKERIKDKPGVSCEIWYYELHHCVDKCVAPKIFAATKE